ncbi:MAG: SWIM zinc finger family protein [Candidatus Moranbacteria bacterium]|nr:SWIM zinc finger family protein [Candidatus Moranbacteria bacterium]
MKNDIKIRIKLKSQLKNMVGNIIYQRGERYFKDGLVYEMNIQEDQNSLHKVEVMGSVSGTQDYEVGLHFNFKNHTFSMTNCNCPYKYFCKHIAALGLEFTKLFGEFLEEKDESIFLDSIREKNEFLKYYQKSKGLLIDENEGIDESFKNKVEENISQKNKIKEIDRGFLEKLKKAGVDPESLPIDVLKNLAQSSENLKKKEISKKNHFEIKTRAEKESLKNKKELQEKNFQERYEVILDVGYRIEFKLREKDQGNSFSYYHQYAYDQYQLEEIINSEIETMTDEQEELLRFWERISFWNQDKFDYETFLNLLKKSGLDIFISTVSGEKKVDISLKPKSKLKASLFTKQAESLLELENDEKITDFIFSLDRKYFERKYFKIITAETGLMILDSNKISFYKMSNNLVNITNRIAEDRKYYQNDSEDILGTLLEEGEIFNLNNLITDLQKSFDLKTELKNDFKIKKFNQAEKVFVVDYNSKESTLKIYPTIDYGFYQIPVTQSIRLRRGMYKQGYERKSFRNSFKYIHNIDLKNKTIFYAPISSHKEINFYKEIITNHEKLGFTKTGKFNLKSDKSIFKFFANNWAEIKKLKYSIKFLKDKFDFDEGDFKAEFDVDFNADKDWLAFDVDCYCGKDQITLETLRTYIDSKDEFIKTADGKFLKVANRKELEKFVLMLESFHQQKSGGKFEGKIYHAPELEDIFTSSNYYNAKLDQGFKKFIKEAQSGKPVEKVKLPANFKKTLRDYQEEGLDWFYFLRKYRFAGILADDMGLGKTLQALILMSLNAKKDQPSLVVCPKTLLYNWQMEAKKFLPKMKTAVIDGQPKERQKKIKEAIKSDLIITSYPTLQRDLSFYKKQKIRFNYCVLDEAQVIKNYRTKNAQIVKRVDADYRLALTGTPLENTVEEIWSIFDFLMPGFLGSHKSFSKKFLKPIMKESSAESLQNLRQKTSCFMLRRTKCEVLQELPPKIENINYCHLEDSQNILYQEILANVKSKIFKTVQEKGFAKSQIHILAGLTKLRQACNHPVLLLKDKNYSDYDSAKLEAFNELIDEIISSGKKVLVFSQFTKMLDILKQDLDKKKIKHLYLSGQTKNRQKIIDEFNAEDSDKNVFLISLKAGGVGLNLTAADNVIIFDPWWNPSVENQAVDRAHRIGQTKSVNVYRLITKGTIEEKIVELQKKKQNLFDNLVGESKDMFKKLTWEDVQDLFG